ncbi:hypothetical protein [uncultured Enterovirga sp.]|uniref:hypothetical protein n=1 Tax=uncultured Enterovirga sp. TaxID=2026352 RepID=UPI0035CA7C62
MLSTDMTLEELAGEIQKKRGSAARADYFQSVFENMCKQGLTTNDPVTVQFGVTGDGYAPNYRIFSSGSETPRMFWGTYHGACDEDFPQGWKPDRVTAGRFALLDVNKFRKA